MKYRLPLISSIIALTMFASGLPVCAVTNRSVPPVAMTGSSSSQKTTKKTKKSTKKNSDKAKKAAEEARRRAEFARQEAAVARERARREAQIAREKAQREAAIARQEAAVAREKAQREAQIAREKAQREAQIARQEAAVARDKAQREAAIARDKAQREAAVAREQAAVARQQAAEARKEAEKVRKEAEKERKKAAGKRNRNTFPSMDVDYNSEFYKSLEEDPYRNVYLKDFKINRKNNAWGIARRMATTKNGVELNFYLASYNKTKVLGAEYFDHWGQPQGIWEMKPITLPAYRNTKDIKIATVRLDRNENSVTLNQGYMRFYLEGDKCFDVPINNLTSLVNDMVIDSNTGNYRKGYTVKYNSADNLDALDVLDSLDGLDSLDALDALDSLDDILNDASKQKEDDVWKPWGSEIETWSSGQKNKAPLVPPTSPLEEK